MTPAARLSAAIELLDAIIRATCDTGPAADTLVERDLRSRRYAGSADRRAIRELVFRAVRFAGDRPESGRAALIGLLEAERPEALSLFDGAERSPAPVRPDEPRARPAVAPQWLLGRLQASLGQDPAELAALVGRAPLDLRVNRLKSLSPEAVAAALPFPVTPVGGLPLALPMALRAIAGSPATSTMLYRDGVIEVQDAGSQAVAAIAAAQPGELVVDLCAGAGGKTLALAADMAGKGRILACDTDRKRLQQLPRRAARAGAAGMIDLQLLDPGREWAQLQGIAAAADLVLVDAPCSGSGTWRRRPELRWRLTPRRLDAVVRLQRELLDIAVALVRPGGRIVYAVCSVLDEEGRAQADALLARHRTLRQERAVRLLPRRHGCDGFFIASFTRNG
ncbi:RsmB/NOP family class I SAM-dependent RNA methyltransferase [Thermaurantiacus sp.]